MNQAAPAWYFRSIRDLWLQHLDVIEKGAVPDIGFRGAITRATVVFIDMGGFTRRANEYMRDPVVAGFLGRHFASLIENWAVLLKADIQQIYLDKIVGDAVMLVIPGDTRSSILLGLRLVNAVLMGPGIYAPHIGLHAGEVCLCDVGLPAKVNRSVAFEQVTVMGSVVNLAARLASAASPGTAAVIIESAQGIAVEPVVSRESLHAASLHVGPPQERELKGFGVTKARVGLLAPANPLGRSGIDVPDMLDRVAELGRRLPRLPAGGD